MTVGPVLSAPEQSAQISTSVFKDLQCVDSSHPVETPSDPTSVLAK